MKLDRIDLKILDLIQHDATLSTADIAAAVGLSTTPAGGAFRTWRSAASSLDGWHSSTATI